MNWSLAGIPKLSSRSWSLWSENSLVKILAAYLVYFCSLIELIYVQLWLFLHKFIHFYDFWTILLKIHWKRIFMMQKNCRKNTKETFIKNPWKIVDWGGIKFEYCASPSKTNVLHSFQLVVSQWKILFVVFQKIVKKSQKVAILKNFLKKS